MKAYDRTRRVAEEIRRELAASVGSLLAHPRASLLSFTAVRLTRDLSQAKVYVTHVLPDPAERQELLAALNAAAIDADPTAYVIGSDQVASFNGQIIGKPHTRERARAQLTDFSGQSITFYTGLCLRRGTTSRVHLEPFTVHFRELTRAEIDHYLDREDVLNCAGSIKSEGLAVHLFRALEGRDPNALMGLPVIALGELLRAAGVSIWDFYPQR